MNIIELYQDAQRKKLPLLKDLLHRFGIEILAASERIPYEKINPILKSNPWKYSILCFYDKKNQVMNFSIEDYYVKEEDEAHLCSVKMSNKTFIAIQQFLNCYYPNIELDGDCQIFPDKGTIEFHFHFVSKYQIDGFDENDETIPYPEAKRLAKADTDTVICFALDLKKIQDENYFIAGEECDKELDDVIPSCEYFPMNGDDTDFVMTASYTCEISFAEPLKI